jgi:hypothetical protein
MTLLNNHKEIKMKIFIGVLLLVGLLFVPLTNAEQMQASAQPNPPQEVQRPDFGGDGVFSFVPPEGFKVVEFPGLKYKIAIGQPAREFAPNMNIVSEDYDKSLKQYADDTVAVLKNQGSNVIERTDFTTDDGAPGIKLVTENMQQVGKEQKKLRQIFFLFDGGAKKFVVTCSTLADDGAKLDGTFDTAMKTFRIIKKTG